MELMNKQKRIRAGIYIALILIFLTAIVIATIKFGPQIVNFVRNYDDLKAELLAYGWKSIPLFILLQAVQVVIAAIPGEVVQLAGGYIYGIVPGTIYSLAGIMAGSVLVFTVTRLLGYPLVKLFVPEKTLDKFNFLINNDKSEIIMFLLFLIPGAPKDILTYIAGITPVKPLRFFTAVTVARLPALFASSVIGANIEGKNYTVAIIVAALAVVLFLAGIIYKDKILHKIHGLARD